MGWGGGMPEVVCVYMCILFSKFIIVGIVWKAYISLLLLHGFGESSHYSK